MSVAHIKSTRQVTRRLVLSRKTQPVCRSPRELAALLRLRLGLTGFDLSKPIAWRTEPTYDGDVVYKQTVEVMAGE